MHHAPANVNPKGGRAVSDESDASLRCIWDIGGASWASCTNPAKPLFETDQKPNMIPIVTIMAVVERRPSVFDGLGFEQSSLRECLDVLGAEAVEFVLHPPGPRKGEPHLGSVDDLIRKKVSEGVDKQLLWP